MPQGEGVEGLRVLWADFYEVSIGELSTPARPGPVAPLTARWIGLPAGFAQLGSPRQPVRVFTDDPTPKLALACWKRLGRMVMTWRLCVDL
jgi:hypothetical protein